MTKTIDPLLAKRLRRDPEHTMDDASVHLNGHTSGVFAHPEQQKATIAGGECRNGALQLPGNAAPVRLQLDDL